AAGDREAIGGQQRRRRALLALFNRRGVRRLQPGKARQHLGGGVGGGEVIGVGITPEVANLGDLLFALGDQLSLVSHGFPLDSNRFASYKPATFHGIFVSFHRRRQCEDWVTELQVVFRW